jgi:DNA-binding SARP family transcriptional activator
MTTLVRHKHNAIYVPTPEQPNREFSSQEPIGHFKMSLFGSFHLEGPNGENLTPRGQKARALLALVALAKRGQRSRIWLCSKLWSDRPAEQAYASLRQALAEIRKALGVYSESILGADKFDVSLDLSKVSVDAVELRLALTEKGLQHAEVPQEDFLEGLNVGDEEFEEWLTIERSRWADVRDELEYSQTAAQPAAWLRTSAPLPAIALHH